LPNRKKPLLLCIMDGWGYREGGVGNAISLARTPNFSRLWQEYPHTLLQASEEAVGLPEGQMGNSEVGHLNIGAGRVVYQELTRINRAIRCGDFFHNPVLHQAMQQVLDSGRNLHLVGMVSDGGVHSHISHLFALLELAKMKGLQRVFIHCFLDGRDVLPQSALEYIDQLEDKMRQLQVGAIATVAGRYYAMDRDKRWDRLSKAYQAMVYGQGLKAASAREAVEQSYLRQVTDEFVEPTVIIDPDGHPLARVMNGDSMIFFNFRADRAREVTRAFVDPGSCSLEHCEIHPDIHFYAMTEYDATIKVAEAFPAQTLDNTLGQVLAQHGLRQLRIAETEKYAHVTFFFNGGVEEPNPGEDRILIPSPKVATYDLQPEMSAPRVTERVLAEIAGGQYDLIILNFANADMVGHTGIIPAAVKAVETVDFCLGRIESAVRAEGGSLLVTADHGNAEAMIDEVTGGPLTAHTTRDVPFILVRDDLKGAILRSGGALEDVAPTILDLLGVAKPAEMTGVSLLDNDEFIVAQKRMTAAGSQQLNSCELPVIENH